LHLSGWSCGMDMVNQFHRFSVPRIEGKIFRKVRCTAKTYNCLERVSRKSMLQLHRSEGCLRTKLCRLDTSSMSRCWSWKHTLFRFFCSFFWQYNSSIKLQMLWSKEFKWKIYFEACRWTRFLVGTSGALRDLQVNSLTKIRLSRATDAPRLFNVFLAFFYSQNYIPMSTCIV